MSLENVKDMPATELTNISELQFPLTNHQANDLACALGEIERHLAEDTDLLEAIKAQGFNLQKEIDGYESVIEKLYQLRCLFTRHPFFK
ncbi:hypothetical protein [Aliagarivorans taiwanensis]|uniref:hypothetical protein n=1 Tax=Aliagarivorans taiwanensis TaxID=561966 RepID=UPI00047DF56F|nr:hypothetical protein [Aliagarivorans taiwanensis]